MNGEKMDRGDNPSRILNRIVPRLPPGGEGDDENQEDEHFEEDSEEEDSESTEYSHSSMYLDLNDNQMRELIDAIMQHQRHRDYIFHKYYEHRGYENIHEIPNENASEEVETEAEMSSDLTIDASEAEMSSDLTIDASEAEMSSDLTFVASEEAEMSSDLTIDASEAEMSSDLTIDASEAEMSSDLTIDASEAEMSSDLTFVASEEAEMSSDLTIDASEAEMSSDLTFVTSEEAEMSSDLTIDASEEVETESEMASDLTIDASEAEMSSDLTIVTSEAEIPRGQLLEQITEIQQHIQNNISEIVDTYFDDTQVRGLIDFIMEQQKYRDYIYHTYYGHHGCEDTAEFPSECIPSEDIPGEDIPGEDIPGEDIPGEDIPCEVREEVESKSADYCCGCPFVRGLSNRFRNIGKRIRRLFRRRRSEQFESNGLDSEHSFRVIKVKSLYPQEGDE